MKVFRPSPWYFPLMCLLLALAACKVNEDLDVVFTIDPEYTVDLFEQRDPADGTPTFGLWMESMANYTCPGYGVDATVQVQNGSIEVKILGVLQPTPCAGDSAPARQFVPLGHLADGTYEFSLSLRDVIENKGFLTVANGYYSLSLPNAQGVYVQHFELNSLPSGITWGYADTPDEASEPVADNFITDLKTLTADDGLAPGFYSYFTVSGTGDFLFHKLIQPEGAARFYVRRLTASPAALQSLLQNYRGAAQQPLQIKCWTTEGEL